jgi:hypothetical protein
MTHRAKKLTDLAHEIPCQAQFKHDCTGRWEQENGKYLSVPAHSNQQAHGRGSYHKSHDCFFAAVCPPAHDLIDGRTPGMDKETKQAEWDRA